MRTTVAAVKSALKSAFQNHPDLSTIQVTYGDPGKYARTESIFLGAANDQAVVDPAGFRAGRKRRDEDYDLLVHITVVGFAPEPEANEARATELGQVVEEYLAENHDLGGAIPGLLWARVSGWTLRTEEGAGPFTTLTYTVNCKARLL